MTTMRAKLQVQSVTKHESCEILQFHAVARSGGYPQDGSDEDNTYAHFSPSADFKITVANPALFGKFVPGQKYYVDFTPADVVATSTATRHPTVPALIQTPLSQQLMPGEWLLVNMQIDGADKDIAEVDYWRIRLNTGCGPQGELEGQPMAHRGFEQADTPAEEPRLLRANSTARVYDVVEVNGRYELDADTHLVDVAGLERIKAHPVVHAVRVANWAALDEWIRYTAAGRPNKAD